MGRLLELSPNIAMKEEFRDGRKWKGVKVYMLVSAESRRTEVEIVDDQYDGVDSFRREGESLDQTMARIYAELIEETRRLNSVIDRVDVIISEGARREARDIE